MDNVIPELGNISVCREPHLELFREGTLDPRIEALGDRKFGSTGTGVPFMAAMFVMAADAFLDAMTADISRSWTEARFRASFSNGLHEFTILCDT